MKPVGLHASPRILASPTRRRWRACHIHRLRPRLCCVQPTVSLDLELCLHGRQLARHHLSLRGSCTTLRFRRQIGFVIFRLSVVNRPFGTKTPFTSLRGEGRYGKRPNRQDEGFQPVDVVIIHGLQTSNLGVSDIKNHHWGQIIWSDICELLLIPEARHVLAGPHFSTPQQRGQSQ